ncbi:Rieske 2Fe-2S domain-containing protein [Dyadobacter psychrotolerans]|uniref:(2Fe-2S)-binding protein n=1 Tax=Dyadobacter psychrotolerans TaxID=2541721 RepID=A0A4R5DNW6_9BACT|nr:Rieske 2Fe-2S domain-containing protein [Dyadobacter psychrotolerans]TDE15257.1 (2Fe-2S)-binding protein [Dyadobacter psychrotolerans]
MTRIEFLKSVGFKGPALMALLTSCVNQQDTVVDALSILATTDTQVTIDTANISGTGAVSVKFPTKLAITTDALNKLSAKLKIDLTTTSNAALLKVGGYLVKSGIVVAQSSSGVLVAATQTCSHEPKKAIIFNKTEFYCTQHGARFSLTGSGLNTYGKNGLTIYKVATDGNTVVIY